MDDLSQFFKVVNRGPELAPMTSEIQRIVIELLIDQIQRRA